MILQLQVGGNNLSVEKIRNSLQAETQPVKHKVLREDYKAGASDGKKDPVDKKPKPKFFELLVAESYRDKLKTPNSI